MKYSLTDGSIDLIKKYQEYLINDNVSGFLYRIAPYDTLYVSQLFQYMYETIPNFLTYTDHIPRYAFWSDAFSDEGQGTEYSTIIVPNNIQTIDSNAFSKAIIHCVDLSHTNIKQLPSNCFLNSYVNKVYLPPQLEYIRDRAFANVRGLCQLEIPATIKNISAVAFLDIYSPLTIICPTDAIEKDLYEIKSLTGSYLNIIRK